MCRYVLDISNSGHDPAASSCEGGNDPFGPIKIEEYADQMRAY
jgi:hypothetical protein